MRNVMFWASIPLLLPLALYVKTTAPRFDPAKGATTGAVGSGRPARLLAIGDSIIAGVGAAELTGALVGQTAAALAPLVGRRIDWQALGVSGYDSEKILRQLLPRLPAETVDYIIVSVGVNDVTGLTRLGRWRENIMLLLGGLQAHSPNAVIAVAGLPPLHMFPLLPQPLRAVFGSRARALDDILRILVAGRRNCAHVPIDFDPGPDPFAADGYHPSEASYVEFGQHMAKTLACVARERE